MNSMNGQFCLHVSTADTIKAERRLSIIDKNNQNEVYLTLLTYRFDFYPTLSMNVLLGMFVVLKSLLITRLLSNWILRVPESSLPVIMSEVYHCYKRL